MCFLIPSLLLLPRPGRLFLEVGWDKELLLLIVVGGLLQFRMTSACLAIQRLGGYTMQQPKPTYKNKKPIPRKYQNISPENTPKKTFSTPMTVWHEHHLAKGIEVMRVDIHSQRFIDVLRSIYT